MPELDKKAVWPGWKTVRLIGLGSYGSVYEIERDVFGKIEKAALKVISIPQNDSDIEELTYSGYDNASITETFKSHLRSIINEYSIMREMNGSSYIVNCDDFKYIEHDDGIGWDILIRMELLTPLFKAFSGDYSEDKVVDLAKDICSALVLCRKHNVVHRDIKPQNIFYSPNGDYKLGDFGIAKTIEKTSGGTKIGTYKYMAPEVYNNQPYSFTADIYSLGLVLYWLLNERRSPFMPLPPQQVVASMEEDARLRRLNGEPLPAPANGSDALKAIVLKACAFDPKDRFQTADEMLEALEKMEAPSSVKIPDPVVSQNEVHSDDSDAMTTGLFGEPQQSGFDAQADDEGTVSLFGNVPGKAKKEAAAKIQTNKAAAERQAKKTSTAGSRAKRPPAEQAAAAHLSDKVLKDAAQAVKDLEEAKKQAAKKDKKTYKEQKEAEAGVTKKKKKTMFIVLGVLALLFVVWFAFFRTAVVPYVTKYSKADAEKRLQEQGFKNYSFQNVESSSIPKGLVVSTDPRYGTKYKINEKITVYISSGPGTVTVPNLVGVSETAALNALKSAGLETDGIARYYTPDVKKGYVISQDPAAGTTAYKGSKVHLSVSAGPETHYLNFNPNGGQVSETKREIAEGSRFGTLPTPTRTGYTFSGWFTAVNGGTQISSSTKMGTSGITVYAHWTKQ